MQLERRCTVVQDRRASHAIDREQGGMPFADTAPPAYARPVENAGYLHEESPADQVTYAKVSAEPAQHGAGPANAGGSEVDHLQREIPDALPGETHDQMHVELARQGDINTQLREANEKLVIAAVKLQNMAEELKKSIHLASHDFLTNLPNRMQLFDRITQAIAWSRRHQSQFAVLFLDLDRFKAVNDTLGHQVGDKLLQLVAERLQNIIRSSDTASRNGGDEFVLVLSEVNHRETLVQKVEDIRAIISAPYCIAEHDIEIGVTIGIGVYPDDGEDVYTLIQNADAAMYAAKENGRDQYQFFRPEMCTGRGDRPAH
jgi:diguanylate cyclase (GGDEF)-like protein